MSEPALDACIATDPCDSDSLTEIVRRAQARDHAAFENLYQHFKSSIWRRLTSLVGEKEVVNDLFQETFLRAWNGLPGTSSDLQFGPWLRRIAANAAIDYLRHSARIEFFPLTDVDQEESQSLWPQVAGPEARVSVVDRGESDNMSAPTIINQAVYFTCEAAPALYKLYALQARTGTLIWVDTLSGEVSFDQSGDQHALYVAMDMPLFSRGTLHHLRERSWPFRAAMVALSGSRIFPGIKESFITR